MDSRESSDNMLHECKPMYHVCTQHLNSMKPAATRINGTCSVGRDFDSNPKTTLHDEIGILVKIISPAAANTKSQALLSTTIYRIYKLLGHHTQCTCRVAGTSADPSGVP